MPTTALQCNSQMSFSNVISQMSQSQMCARHSTYMQSQMSCSKVRFQVMLQSCLLFSHYYSHVCFLVITTQRTCPLECAFRKTSLLAMECALQKRPMRPTKETYVPYKRDVWNRSTTEIYRVGKTKKWDLQSKRDVWKRPTCWIVLLFIRARLCCNCVAVCCSVLQCVAVCC